MLAQNRNYIWISGLDLGGTHHYGIDFNSGIADTFSVFEEMNFADANAIISDTLGQVLFYTNGIYINNRNHDSLLNTTGFNPGYATTYYQQYGLHIPQSCLIIPKPGNSALYYIIHESAEIIQHGAEYCGHPLNLSYTVVDMNLDGGLGGVVNGMKNLHLIDDTLTWGRMSACKHANGRDYWLLVHRYFSNTFYKILITPDSFFVDTQSIGLFNPFFTYVGQSKFSEDGSKYSIQLNDSTVDLFNFDRCTGMLSNETPLMIADGQLDLLGQAFSKSGRFLYLCNNIYIHQLDSWAGNIISTDQIVAQWDTFFSPGATTFYMLQLAPDNRIYVSNYDGNNRLHYIEFPDSMRTACNVVQNNFITPGYNTFSFPNIVNYDLMNDTTSACDTVLSVTPFKKGDGLGVRVFPNPAQEYFWINYSSPVNEKVVFELYDAIGNKVQQHILYCHSKTLLVHTENLMVGIYFYNINSHQQKVSTGKIVILK